MFNFPSLVPPLRFRRARPSLTVDFSVFWSAPNIFTFTRATTATVKDFEGLIKSCLSGELRIQGARREYNQVTNSTTLTAAGSWAVAGGAVTVTAGIADPDGGTTAARLTTSGANKQWYAPAVTTVAGRVFSQSCWIRRVTGSGTIRFLNAAGNGGEDISGTLTSQWQRIAGAPVTTSGASFWFGLEIATSGDEVDVWHPSLNEVTGRSNQNPPEYVSTGTLSSPYHGYFVDGVKYFSYQNGNTVASNVVTEAQGAAITGTIGYLAEGARTNLCLWSQEFDNASWVKSNVTVVANQAVAPDGTTTADLVYPTTTGANRQIVQTISGSAAGAVTGGVYAKAAGLTWLLIGGVAGGQNVGVYFDLTNGVVGTQAIGTGAIEDVGDGWYRCSVSVTETDTTSYLIAGGVDADNTNNATTNGTDGVYMWQGQVETAAFLSSPIVTTTAAVARNADVLSAPSAGIVDIANGTTVFVKVASVPSTLGSAAAVLFCVASGVGDYVTIYINASGFVVVETFVSSGATAVVTGTTDVRGTTNLKVAAVFKTNDVRLYVNGIAEGTPDTNCAMPTVTTINIGSFVNGALQPYMPIAQEKVYRTAFSAARAIAETAP